MCASYYVIKSTVVFHNLEDIKNQTNFL